MMKPVLKGILGLAITLLCFVLFVPIAHAEEVRIGITATPTELPDSGSVLFTFEITNYNADYPMNDVAISTNGVVCYELKNQTIPQSGSVRDIKVTLNVSQSQLGKPIPFVVTWTRNGEPMSQEASITVQQAENPIISVTRTASMTNAKSGDKVILTYTVKNATKFDMSDITLIDENISDTPILQLDSLRASGTYSIDYTYTMGDESVTSTPFVTYTVNGKTKTFSSLDPLELVMVLIQLDMKVQEGVPTQNGVTFTLDVKNTGTQAISDITISDERLSPVNAAPFSLAPGEETSLTYVVVPVMSEPLRKVQFALNGTDSFSNPYTLAPEDVYEVYPYVDDSQINVAVRAETVTPWTSETGTLSARITITNHSTVALASITVLETNIGVIKNYETLAAGETSFDLDIQLGSPRNLTITVKGYDPTGANRELASCVMPVAYGTETAETQEVTPVPNTGGLTIFGGLLNGVTKILIILGALMVLSFILLIALTAMERAKTPRLNRFGDDEWDDEIPEPPSQPERRHINYDDEPNQEEIRYTRRMLAQKEEPVRKTQQEPIYLPPPAVVVETPPVPKERSARMPEEPTIQPARQTPEQPRERVAVEQEQRQQYVPAPPVQPKQSVAAQESNITIEHKSRTSAGAAPRVFEYKRQAVPQPKSKQTVTHVRKGERDYEDDEE